MTSGKKAVRKILSVVLAKTLVEATPEGETVPTYNGKVPGYSANLGRQAMTAIFDLSETEFQDFCNGETIPEGLEDLSDYIDACVKGGYQEIVTN